MRSAVALLLKLKKYIPAILPTVARIMMLRDERRFVYNKDWKHVLEIGARKIPIKDKITFSSYKILDIEENQDVDYIQDIHKTTLKPASFDSILAFEVLEHLYNPHQAVKEMHRLLKKDGVWIGSTRFIYPYHGIPYDYFRFTKYSLKYIFKDFAEVQVYQQGNVFTSIWDLMTNTIFLFPLKIFNPFIALIHCKNSKAPSGFTIIAKKEA